MEPSVELYPNFEASSLQFSLNSIPSLPSYQLALVQYHPSSTFYHQTVARNEWKRRRTESLLTIEEGSIEKEEELRRLMRYKDELDRSRKKMVDSAVGTEERMYSQEEFAEKESEARLLTKLVSKTSSSAHPSTHSQATASTETSNGITSSNPVAPSTSSLSAPLPSMSSPPAPLSHLPPTPLASPGPMFSLIKHGRGAAISPKLQSLFTVVQVTNVPPSTTPLVVLYFLRRAVKPSATLPRPLALAKDNNRILLAFRSVDQAERAVNLLRDKIFPAVKGFGPGQRTRSAVTPTLSYLFKHNELADEVRTSWLISGELPIVSEMEQVENLPGKQWSKEYETEIDFIKGQSKGKESSRGGQGGDPKLASLERVKKRDRTESTQEETEAVKAIPPHLVASEQRQIQPIQSLLHRAPVASSSSNTRYTGPANPPPFYNPSYQFQPGTRTPAYNPPSFEFSNAPTPFHHPFPFLNPLTYGSYPTLDRTASNPAFNRAFKRPRQS